MAMVGMVLLQHDDKQNDSVNGIVCGCSDGMSIHCVLSLACCRIITEGKLILLI
mgnify:CR=1 FL=1